MHFANHVRSWRVARLYNVQYSKITLSETVRNRIHVHIYTCLLRIADTLTFQNTDLSFWNNPFINVIYIKHSFIIGTTVFVGPWPLLQFPNLFYTDERTPWTSDQPVARPLPTHRTTQTKKRTHKHPCLERDLNPRSQCSREGRQYMP
jgi:hypothetical protein